MRILFLVMALAVCSALGRGAVTTRIHEKSVPMLSSRLTALDQDMSSITGRYASIDYVGTYSTNYIMDYVAGFLPGIIGAYTYVFQTNELVFADRTTLSMPRLSTKYMCAGEVFADSLRVLEDASASVAFLQGRNSVGSLNVDGLTVLGGGEMESLRVTDLLHVSGRLSATGAVAGVLTSVGTVMLTPKDVVITGDVFLRTPPPPSPTADLYKFPIMVYESLNEGLWADHRFAISGPTGKVTMTGNTALEFRVRSQSSAGYHTIVDGTGIALPLFGTGHRASMVYAGGGGPATMAPTLVDGTTGPLSVFAFALPAVSSPLAFRILKTPPDFELPPLPEFPPLPDKIELLPPFGPVDATISITPYYPRERPRSIIKMFSTPPPEKFSYPSVLLDYSEAFYAWHVWNDEAAHTAAIAGVLSQGETWAAAIAPVGIVPYTEPTLDYFCEGTVISPGRLKLMSVTNTPGEHQSIDTRGVWRWEAKVAGPHGIRSYWQIIETVEVCGYGTEAVNPGWWWWLDDWGECPYPTEPPPGGGPEEVYVYGSGQHFKTDTPLERGRVWVTETWYPDLLDFLETGPGGPYNRDLIHTSGDLVYAVSAYPPDYGSTFKVIPGDIGEDPVLELVSQGSSLQDPGIPEFLAQQYLYTTLSGGVRVPKVLYQPSFSGSGGVIMSLGAAPMDAGAAPMDAGSLLGPEVDVWRSISETESEVFVRHAGSPCFEFLRYFPEGPSFHVDLCNVDKISLIDSRGTPGEAGYPDEHTALLFSTSLAEEIVEVEPRRDAESDPVRYIIYTRKRYPL